jgi:Ca-activated chloride channel homolog
VTFDRPLVLIALAAVPALIVLWLVNERRRHEGAARFASLALIPNLVDRVPGRLRLVPLALLLLGLTALIVGAARPHTHLTVPRKDATVVVAVDISRSMAARDVPPSRLAAAVSAADRFVHEIPGTYSVGLVAFGSRAYVAVPPTRDRTVVEQGLTGLRTGEGTAIGDAVLLAAQLGQRQREADGVVPPTSVLVISDGARDGGRTKPEAAAARARALHVPVSTVLIGTNNGQVTAHLVGGYTEQIRVPPDPGTLQLIARTTGGTFYRARDPKALTGVYRKLATRLGHTTEDRQVSDLFAGGAIVLLLLGGGLSTVLYRRLVP